MIDSSPCKNVIIILTVACLVWSLMLSVNEKRHLAGALRVSTGGGGGKMQPFSDRMVLSKIDEKSSQTVEHLGRLIKLDTSVNQDSTFACKFSIETRTARESQHEMKPGKYCTTNLCGNYQFDLMGLDASGFDPERRTVILISGFWSGDRIEWIENATRLWLEAEDVNVIKVSWSAGNRYRYGRAVAGTPIVARQTTILLHHLAGLHGLQFTDSEFAGRVQIVGHSLGAHIAAFVGQDLGGRLGRITGLDPAGPFFDKQPRSRRLDPTDARLVDVIHTNSGKMRYHNAIASSAPAGLDWLASKLPGLSRLNAALKGSLGEAYDRDADTCWFGIDQQVGHVDYYANDGRIQPGCESYLHLCDHGRSTDIYEDLLQHEVRVLKLYGADDDQMGRRRRLRRESRLLAFKSKDYGSFKEGASMRSACGSILEMGVQRHDIVAATRRCSLPIDLLAPVDELIEELANEYGVESLRLQPARPDAGAKYFFGTRSARPLVGNHYALKVAHSGRDVWSDSCSIKAQLTMPDGSETELDMLKEVASSGRWPLFGGNGRARWYTGVFVAPTWEPLSSLTSQWNSDRAHRFLPLQVRLTINGWQRSSSIPRAVGNKIWAYFSIKSGLSKCTLTVNSIEILPLMSSTLGFVGLYGDPNQAEILSAAADSLAKNLTSILMTN